AIADPAHDMGSYAIYDAMGRAIYTGDATGAVVALQYDADGNLTQRIAYAKPIATNVKLTKEAVAAAITADPLHDISVRNVYDKDDRLVWSVDGLNAVTQRIYDQDGDLLQLKQYA